MDVNAIGKFCDTKSIRERKKQQQLTRKKIYILCNCSEGGNKKAALEIFITRKVQQKRKEKEYRK